MALGPKEAPPPNQDLVMRKCVRVRVRLRMHMHARIHLFVNGCASLVHGAGSARLCRLPRTTPCIRLSTISGLPASPHAGIGGATLALARTAPTIGAGCWAGTANPKRRSTSAGRTDPMQRKRRPACVARPRQRFRAAGSHEARPILGAAVPCERHLAAGGAGGGAAGWVGLMPGCRSAWRLSARQDRR